MNEHPAVLDFLTDLGLMMKGIDEHLEEYRDWRHPGWFGVHEKESEELSKWLSDTVNRKTCRRIVRSRLRSLAFHMLVLFDEGREIGESGVEVRLEMKVGGKPVECPTYLGELLGEGMERAGLDTLDWN